MALNVQIAMAAAKDVAAVETLLAAASLPTDGLRDQFPAAYAVARVDGALVGVAGLERYGAFALLRSVTVLHNLRGQGIARALVEERMALARSIGVVRAFLLTTTAPDYFRKLGFETSRREDAPSEIAASVEFAHACPASATCLSRAP